MKITRHSEQFASTEQGRKLGQARAALSTAFGPDYRRVELPAAADGRAIEIEDTADGRNVTVHRLARVEGRGRKPIVYRNVARIDLHKGGSLDSATGHALTTGSLTMWMRVTGQASTDQPTEGDA